MSTTGYCVSFTIIGYYWRVTCLPRSNIWWGYIAWNQSITWELCIAHINIQGHDNEQSPVWRAFFPASYILISQLNPCLNSWGLVTSAKSNFLSTTQNGTKSAIMSLSQRYFSYCMYNYKRLKGRFATDKFYADMKSFHRNTCFQVYSYKVGFSSCSPKINAGGGRFSDKHLITSSMTLVFLNISPLMDFNPKLEKIRSSTRICGDIGLITISLHRANPMKILLKVL